MDRCKTFLLLAFLAFSSSLQAQFPAKPRTTGNTSNYNTGGFNNRYNNNRSNAYDPLTGQLPGIQVDSLGTDSTQQVKEIKPDTKFWDKKALFLHKETIKFPWEADIANHHYWDEAFWGQGFVRSLGQIGKPYEAYQLGVSERYLDLPLWENVVFGRYNRYVIDAEQQVKYIDTHTPYVNLNYAQGPRRFLATDVNASINLRPRLNITTFYERRRMDGIYRGMTTSHTEMYLSANYHTKNDKYFAFGTWVFNELDDGINGGMMRSRNNIDFYTFDGNILIENLGALNSELENKNLATNILDDASRKILNRSLYFDHYYHLVSENDSIERPHRLTLRNSLLYTFTAYRFTDAVVSQSTLTEHLFEVYPHLDPDSLVLDEAFLTNHFKILGGASYTYDGLFRFNLHGDLNYQRVSFRQDRDSSAVQHDITEQNVYAELDIKRIKAEAEIHQRTSNLFAPARQIKLGGTLLPFKLSSAYVVRDTLPDSLKVETKKITSKKEKEPESFLPLKISFHYNFKDIQPTLFHTQFTPRSGSTYLPNPGLNNEQITQLVGQIRYDQTVPISRGDTLLSNYFYAKAYLYRHNQMIYFSPQFERLQAADGDALTRIGVELGWRIRFLRRMHWESQVGFQTTSVSDGVSEDFAYYAKNLPSIHAKTALFYDIRNISIARKLRIGIEAEYNNSFNGMTVDPMSGEFFPANYRVPGYVRADVFLAAHLRSAHVYLKYYHVNEGLFVRGYYTTPAYPMLERSLVLGVNWPFFD